MRNFVCFFLCDLRSNSTSFMCVFSLSALIPFHQTNPLFLFSSYSLKLRFNVDLVVGFLRQQKKYSTECSLLKNIINHIILSSIFIQNIYDP